MIQIPTAGTPYFAMSIPLDDASYILEFRWNSRGEFWVMNVLTDVGDPLLMGVKLVHQYPLTEQYQNNEVPPGEFIAGSPEEGYKRITLDDLKSGKAAVIYLATEDLV